MTQQTPAALPILVSGGGIGGLAAALAMVRQGFEVTVFEQAPEIGEIGAGIQLGPNAFHAFDALGVGDKARGRAVYTDYMVMHDALDEYQVGKSYQGQALIAADGGKSVVRQQYVNDPPRVTGHVVYRAVVDKKDFPENLQWNAASIWGGPNCHLVHYPLRGGEQYNVVVTFHSREKEEWGVTDGSKEEVQSYFQGIAAKPRQLIDLPKALALYQKSRVAPTARIVLSGREMGRLYHAKGVERLVRNDLWKGRSAERLYDAMEWLYGWNVGNCLAAE